MGAMIAMPTNLMCRSLGGSKSVIARFLWLQIGMCY